MNEKQLANKSGICTGIAAACCFGLLNVLFTLFGITAAILWINHYGDYLFFPMYAFFGTIFATTTFRLEKRLVTYLLLAVWGGLALYFSSFGIVYTTLIICGIVAGGIVWWLLVR